VLTGGAGARAMSHAFEDIFSVRDAFRNIPMRGRTDAIILSDAAAAHGIPPDAADLLRFPDVYLAHLQMEIDRPGPRKGVMPGVRRLLATLSARNDVYMALLTGNYKSTARVKLEYFDLWHYFRCGAFADDCADRNELLPVAVKRIHDSDGLRLHASEAIVIGDTPLDVACAAASCARSIAVATGGFDMEALRLAGADVVLRDLADTPTVLDALMLDVAG
jgi:phosphoglycolate phosphatase-like HAD superfamily hydrolase